MTQRPWWGERAGILWPLRDAADLPPLVMQVEGRAVECNPAIASILPIPDVMSGDERARLLELASVQPVRRGRMLDYGDEARQCHFAWLPKCSETAWIYERVALAFQRANEQFRVRLTGIIEPVMAVAYDEGDHCGWHLDTGAELAATRKLSLSLLVSGPGEYEGGALEFCGRPGDGFVPAAGTAIVFPAFLAHRVAPVTRGRRIALVAFAHGPSFA